jgi:hypothetical protein
VRNYYITRSGRLARQDNTLYLETETEDGKPTKTPISIEDVDALYLYGEIDLNTRLLNFLAQKNPTASANSLANVRGLQGVVTARSWLTEGTLCWSRDLPPPPPQVMKLSEVKLGPEQNGASWSLTGDCTRTYTVDKGDPPGL